MPAAESTVCKNSSMGVNMDCYGNYKCDEACLICEYQSSCRFYTNSPNLRLLSADHLSLDMWRDDYLGKEDPFFDEETEFSIPLKKNTNFFRRINLGKPR